MENISHSFKNRRQSSARNFWEFQADFFDKSNSDFYGIISWILKEQGENLERKNFVANLLVN